MGDIKQKNRAIRNKKNLGRNDNGIDIYLTLMLSTSIDIESTSIPLSFLTGKRYKKITKGKKQETKIVELKA